MPSDSGSDNTQHTRYLIYMALHWGMLGTGLLTLLLGLMTVLPRMLDTQGQAADHRQLRRAQDHFILPCEVDADAAELLARAQKASATVLGTAVHEKGLIDRQYNDLALPTQVWAIACNLTEYTRLTADLPQQADTPVRQKAARTRRAQLDTIRQGIDRRVAALEECTEKAAEAGRCYTEWEQTRQLTAGDDDVLALLAATAADEIAVAEVQAMTAQARTIAEALHSAVGTARAAGARALPRTAAA
ncbi:hypothetical protein [Streptomyces sp. NPDC002521]